MMEVDAGLVDGVAAGAVGVVIEGVGCVVVLGAEDVPSNLFCTSNASFFASFESSAAVRAVSAIAKIAASVLVFVVIFLTFVLMGWMPVSFYVYLVLGGGF